LLAGAKNPATVTVAEKSREEFLTYNTIFRSFSQNNNNNNNHLRKPK